MNLKIKSSEVVDTHGKDKYVVLVVQSESNPNIEYRVDVTNYRCSCPGWKFARALNGERKACKHLRAAGCNRPPVQIDLFQAEPPKSNYAVHL